MTLAPRIVAWLTILFAAVAGTPAARGAEWYPLDTTASAYMAATTDFTITPDSQQVVLRGIDSQSTFAELVALPIAGGSRTSLSGTTAYGAKFLRWLPAGDTIVYWSDQLVAGRVEVFAAPRAGGGPVALNGPLQVAGSPTGELSSDRVVYIACEITTPFFEPIYELFSTPLAGGVRQQLSGPLVAGGDVRSLLVSPATGRVIYLADQETDEVIELFSADAAGQSLVKLNPPLIASGDIVAAGLQFSPLGDAVLYAADQDVDEMFELYLVPSIGGAAVKLNGPLVAGGDVKAGTQAFSPTGDRVVYLADQLTDEVVELFSVAATGGPPVRLNPELPLSSDVLNERPQFAAGGSRVIYRADQRQDEVIELFSVPVDGGDSVALNGPLAPGGDVAADVQVSPDGGRVLYRADQQTDTVMELYSVAATGGTPQRLNGDLPLAGNVVRALFSPDGTSVAYLADQEVDQVFELYWVPSAGGAAVKLNGPLVAGGDVTDWQFTPDGRTIVYRADQEIDERFQLFGVTLPTLAELAGDFNADGQVDAADYTVWRDGLGDRYTPSDYALWAANFGAGAASAAIVVPEPTTWLLALVSVAIAAGALRPGALRRRPSN